MFTKGILNQHSIGNLDQSLIGYSINITADTRWMLNQLLGKLSEAESQLIFAELPLSVDQYLQVS